MADYNADRKWSDKFVPQLKQIIADLLIVEAPQEEDMQRNTDLVVFTVRALRVACRVRRYQYLLKWPNDFTIREGRPSGAKAELTKIVEGWGDYFVYAFADEQEQGLCAWRVIDLSQFRIWFMRSLVRLNGKSPGDQNGNGDGSSWFRAFDTAQLPNGIVIREVMPVRMIAESEPAYAIGGR